MQGLRRTVLLCIFFLIGGIDSRLGRESSAFGELREFETGALEYLYADQAPAPPPSLQGGELPVDLHGWTAESYPAVSGFGAGVWTVSADGSSVFQSINGQPTLFYSDFNAFNTQVEGLIRITGGGDDDFVGFALGYQPGDTGNPSADYLLIDWKAGTQSFDFGAPSCTPGTSAPRGLAVSRVSGIPTADEFWGHVNFDQPACSGPGSGLQELARGSTRGSVGWALNTDYRFRFEFTPSNLRMYVNDTPEIDIDGQFADGRLAFYNFSQAGVSYSGFSRQELAPDLVINSVNPADFTGDWQSLAVSGRVEGEIKNVGTGDAIGAFQVLFFEDLNFNGVFDLAADNLLGTASVPSLAAGASTLVSANIATTVLFRNNLIYAFVDSGAAISESDETNNYGDSGLGCELEPVFTPFDPVLEWSWTSSTVPGFENWLNVMMTPVVIDLDGDSIPEIVFASTASTSGGFVEQGVLRAIRGDTGAEVFTVTDPANRVNTATSPAAADIDADGRPEIVACDNLGRRLICFEHDGTFKWRSPDVGEINWGAVSIADLDGNGVPEIIIGKQVLKAADGTLYWPSGGTGGSGGIGSIGNGPISLVADIDLDGSLDVVAGNTVYSSLGSAKWPNLGLPDGLNAVGNFDLDIFPEIVLVAGGTVRLLEHTGAVKWASALPGGGGGPPTVADFDGDGQVEIGVAGQSRYAVFETNGTPKWSARTQDPSSVTGSSVFDFEGDGAAEVVYRDERFLRVYRGNGQPVDSDGFTLPIWSVAMSSCTWHEYVLVADVDADGEAEILAVANNNCGRGPERGIRVFGSGNGGWVPTRKIWNQHTYHITNVNDDGTIPAVERNNWLYPPERPFNNYRQNILSEVSPLASPDLTASFLRFGCETSPRFVTARIGNGGAIAASAGVPVSFYDGDPATGGILLGTTTTLFPMPPGLFEDATIQLPESFDCTRRVWAVADDDGTFTGALEECDEDNNIHDHQVENAFENLADVTLNIGLDFVNTTYDRRNRRLVFQAKATNNGDVAIDRPLLLVIDNISSPNTSVANPDGFTPDGKPYFVFLDPTRDEGPLEPSDETDTFTLVFNTDTAAPVFTWSWLAPANHPPVFTSFPATSATVGREYRYGAVAVDPDMDSPEYALLSGPPGMTIDPTGGLVAWTPVAGDIGGHTVTIEATDGRGGRATQRFAIQVAQTPVNRPPLFTSAPVTQASVGAGYEYVPAASDPDGDTVSFVLLDGPSDMGINTNGAVIWDFVLPGQYPVTIRAEDGNGGYADQGYVLFAGTLSTNPHVPSLFGTPAVIAAVGQLYFYQPAANDADGDTLAFDLPTKPAGMAIDAATGRVTWTPVAGQLGAHSVVLTVSDGNGGSASQAWTIMVSATLPNRPPVIDSVPNFIAEEGRPYEYDVSAIDPEGGVIAFALVSPPSGMTISPTSGLINWTPAAPGPVTVAIKASDAQLAFGSQVFTLNVSPPNVAPVITSTAGLNAVIGATYRYDVHATDGNPGQVLTFVLVAGPQGMSIDPQTGLVLWTPTDAQEGSHPVTVEVRDGYGGSASQSFTVTAATDTQPPVVRIVPSRDPALIDEPFQICVQASDDASLIDKTLTINSNGVELDSAGCVTLTRDASQTLFLEATATDGAGNVGTAARTLQVIDPNDPNAPTIVLISPDPGPSRTITAKTPVDLVATITDDPVVTLNWEVRLARGAPDGEYTVLNSNGGEVIEAVVATLDPTMLPNDTYFVVIWASDLVHQRTVPVLRVFVEGDLKLGNFSLEFVDLSIPVAGFPLVVTRQYNSLDTSVGDFGHGWRLGLPGKVVDEPKEGSGQGLNIGSKVYVTRPDGRRVGFKVGAFPPSFFFPFIVEVYYTPDPGVTDKLEVPGAGLVFNFGGFLNADFSSPYNPNEYKLTTRDGREYVIDEQLGLRSMRDRNGNVITVTPGGLSSSSGLGLTFVRDGEGRITQVIEPDDPADGEPPGVLEYEYDAAGNLTLFRDQTDAETLLYYEYPQFPHYLSRIVDPLGRTPVRGEYDADGRLIALIDGSGHRIDLSHDPQATTQTIYDGLGNPTTLVYDEDGNPIRLINAHDKVTERTYDAENRLTSETDPLGNTTEYSYDGGGNLQSIVRPHPSGADPADYTTTFTWAGDQPASISTPAGPRMILTYDDRGNVLSLRDGAGTELESSTYDARGLITSRTDAYDTSAFEYDSHGRNTRVIENDTEITNMSFDANGRVLSMIPPDGESRQLAYDAKGRQTTYEGAGDLSVAIEYGPGSDFSSITTSVAGRLDRKVHDNGQLAGWMRADGTEVDYEYDMAGRLAVERSPLGHESSYSYDAVGRLTKTTSPRGGLSTISYDDAGRITSRQDMEGNLTTFTPGDCCGRVASMTNPRGKTWTYSYSPTTTTVRDPLLRETTVVTSAQGLPIRSVLADGRTIELAYDGESLLDESDSRVTLIRDEGDNTREYAYDEEGRLASATDLGEGVHTFTYSDRGLSQWTGPTGEALAYDYDDEGDLVERTRSGGSSEAYSYDSSNELASVRYASGATIDYSYDMLGQELMRTPSAGNPVNFAYDDAGNMTMTTDNTGSTHYAYDAEDQLRSITYPFGGTVVYTRDLNSRIIQIDVSPSASSTAFSTFYEYDSAGNLTKVIDPLGGATLFAYDVSNRLTRRTLPNAVETIYEYTLLDQMRKITHRTGGGNILAAITYDRAGGIGEPRRIDREDGSYVELEYDSAVRLVRERYYAPTPRSPGSPSSETFSKHSGEGTEQGRALVGIAARNTGPSAGGAVQPVRPTSILIADIRYAYDAAGNRTAKLTQGGDYSYQYELGFRMTAVDGPGASDEAYSYDSDGRQSSIHRPGEQLVLSYDVFGQLSEVEDLLTNDSTNYEYDAIGRRVKADTGGSIRQFLVAPGVDERFDSTHAVADDTGQLTGGFVYAAEMPFMRFEGGAPTYYLTDASGSVIGLVDQSGSLTAQFSYDGFGEILSKSGPASAPPPQLGGDYRFHGMWQETASNLYHARSREYDSHTGRFTRLDPAEPDPQFPESMHPYAFAHNNPHLFIDPDGRTAFIETALKQVIREAMREAVFDAGGSIATEFLATLLGLFLPHVPGLESIDGLAGGIAQGRKFEELLTQAFCGLFAGAGDYLWLEVPMSAGGKPLGDGLSCNPDSNGKPIGRLQIIERSARPDYLVSKYPPTDVAAGKGKSFIVGDFKLSIDAMYRDWVLGRKRRQFLSIANHARKYEFARVTVSFALRRQKTGLMNKRLLILEKFWSKGVYGAYVWGAF